MSNDLELISAVRLTKTIDTNVQEFDGIMLTIEAMDADDVSVPVFVFQREVINEAESTPDVRDKAFFSNVASPNDWQELPIGVPEDEDIVLFLYHKIQVFVRTAADAEYIWTEVSKDVRALIEHHKFMLSLLVGEPDEILEID